MIEKLKNVSNDRDENQWGRGCDEIKTRTSVSSTPLIRVKGIGNGVRV